MSDNRKCQALDDDGEQCKEPVFAETTFHGDRTLYRTLTEEDCVAWVKIGLCKKHYDATP